jgi:PAS domain S-box-containing protein
MLGYTEEDLHALTFAEFTHPDDVEPNLTLFRQAMSGEIDRYELDKRYIHKQGHVVWGHVSTGVVRGPTGQALYVVGHIEDITERKRLEQEREAARAQAERQAEELDRIVEAMADAVVVYDANGCITRVNSAARRTLGLNAAPADYFALAALERNALYAMRDAEGLSLAVDASPKLRALRREVLTGANAVDIRLRTFDECELEVNASAAPLRDPDGHIVGAVGVYRDLTERNRLERATREQTRQLEATFAAITDAVILYDREGTI